MAREGGAIALLQDGLVDALDAAVALGATGGDAGVADAGLVQGSGEGAAGELAGVVGSHAVEPPAVAGQAGDDVLNQRGGVVGGGIVGGVMEAGPAIAGGHINGGVVPGAPAGASQLTDVEAVQLHQIARLLCLNVADGLGDLGPQLRRGLVARDEAQAFGARVEARAA